MKKILICMQALVATMLLAACLHDDNEVFDEPAAQRLDKAVENYKQVLESAPNGWKLNLWTEPRYSGGGYTYLMKFKDGKVTVASELTDADKVATSSYDIKKDMGPVLTVNTYNEIFHSLSNPSLRDDDGKGQDYEFIIQRVTNDSIFVEGKKFHNKMVMTRLNDNVNWKEHIGKMKDVADNVKFNYKYIAGNDTTKLYLSSARRARFTIKDSVVYVPFCYTENGIELQAPVTVGGKQVQHFAYDIDKLAFTGSDTGTGGMVFTTNYMRYADYAGTYNFEYKKASVKVRMVPAGDEKTYWMEGLSPDFKLTFVYDKKTGTLTWSPEKIYTDPNKHEHWMCSWDAGDTGQIFRYAFLGFVVNKDFNKPGVFLTFTSTLAGYLNLDSMIIIEYNGSKKVGESTTVLVNGSAQILMIKGMTKINND